MKAGHILLFEGSNQGECALITAFAEGLKCYGLSSDTVSKTAYSPDLLKGAGLLVTGRLASSEQILKDAQAQNVNFVYFDKGYTHRGWKTKNPEVYFRFSVNGFHPLDYFQDIPRRANRWDKLGILLKPRRKNGENIVFAGCTHKFARFSGFEPQSYAENIVHEIRSFTKRPIVYRPKPSDHDPVPIPDTRLSYEDKTIEEELKNCHALVTYSSNAAMDAVLAGVPAFVLGPSIAKPVANTDLAQIESPFFPSDSQRRQWAYDLAYCQWNFEEIKNGALWKDLNGVLSRVRPEKSSFSFSS